MDLGAMAVKGTYSAFPKAPSLLEPYHQFSVISKTLVSGDLPLCREAVSVFYSPNLLVSYPGHSLAGTYLSAEKQSVYSTAPID